MRLIIFNVKTVKISVSCFFYKGTTFFLLTKFSCEMNFLYCRYRRVVIKKIVIIIVISKDWVS